MKYTYQFADKTLAIEVEEEWVTILEDEDRREYNNNHAQTRRHCSLEEYNLDDALIPADVDIERDLITAEEDELLKRQIIEALQKLTPDQRELIEKVVLGGIPLSKFAKERGTDQGAVSHMKERAIKRMKKYFQNPTYL